MRPTLFISDLHINDAQPAIKALFLRFLETTAPDAAALYILGDLFDYWVGDDQLEHDAVGREVAGALRRLADAGLPIFLMHGNRDFMIGARFAGEAGVTLLPDVALIDLNDAPVLLLHGDTLCTDDIAYQAFRLQARNPAWQSLMLTKPYAARQALAQSIRMQSEGDKSGKSGEIMDVSLASVEAVFREYRYPTMIHGHTHRPMTHSHLIDGHSCQRWVLADWHAHGQYLSAAGGNFIRINVDAI